MVGLANIINKYAAVRLEDIKGRRQLVIENAVKAR